jgi:Ni,Fe-hydrogenase III large subunit
MQIEVDPELARSRIETARREITHELVTRREEELHMIIEAQRGKLRELLATEDDPHHFRSQLLHPGHGNLTALRVVSDTHD